jgi:hypothetical protein
MPSHSAVSAGAAPGEPSLGWLLLIPLGCLALGQAILAISGILPVLDGALGDPDAYMRLSRVLELHDSGSWFDSRFPRINPPDGHVQHWTRPLDALLLAGAWLLQPFLGFERALYVWGVLISPALLALAVLAVAWAAAPALDRDTRLFACLALLTQPAVLAYTGIGRPDHHSLLLLLALVLIGLTARLAAAPHDRRLAGLAGAIAGLGIWVSCEAMTFVAVSLVALGLFWLAGAPGMARASRAYVLTTALVLAGALLLERGPDGLLAVETDRLSAAHVVLFTLVAAFWSAVAWAEAGAGARRTAGAPLEPPETALRAMAARSQGALIGRTLAALVGSVVVAGTMLALFPELRQGPLGHVDPLYARLRLQNIVEIQPLMPAQWLMSGRLAEAVRRVVEFLGIGLFALPCLGLLLVRCSGPARCFWATVALAMLVFVPLAFHQVRWTSYAEAFLVWPYAAAVAWLLGRFSGALDRSGTLLRPLIILAALFWPFAVAAALPQQVIQSAGRACPVERLAAVLNRAAPAPRTLLAYADYGSELLYRTPHRVLSIPNHRPQPGFAATWRILTSTDDRVAQTELARFGVDWILLCPNRTERVLFGLAGAAAPTLYQRLADGEPPDWLRALPLEEEVAAAARLFEVVGGDRRRAVAAGVAAR